MPRIDEEPIGALVTRLFIETQNLAHAEIALVKAKVDERAAAYKTAALFFAVAGTLAFAGLIALLVGLIIWLATMIGAGWATIAVVGTTFVVVAALALVGKSKLARPLIDANR